jgi:putative YhdH/YhfP family quinone oxidoreductase
MSRTSRPERLFRALVVHSTENGIHRQIEERTEASLPAGELLVRVCYSSLNYKDGLSASGHRGVTRRYPHTPGVDAAGIVEASDTAAFQPGAQVIVHGYDLGMNTPGGFGQYIQVPAGWALPLPTGLDLYTSMVWGTAGFTAALALRRLLDAGLTPERGEVLVTGATGGVGSLAVALLAHTGFRCVAATGKLDQAPLLYELGATEVIDRQTLESDQEKALLPPRWAGVIDTVGGRILANAIKSTQANGAIAACGNAASPDLNLTVFPFILRGVSLLGVDSANCTLETRRAIWTQIAGPWRAPGLERFIRCVTLEGLEPEIERILQGRQVGHVIVDLWG